MKDSETTIRRSTLPLWLAWLPIWSFCLVACAPPAEEDRAAGENRAVEPSSADSPAGDYEIGRPGGRLVLSATSDPRTFNPAIALSGSTLSVLHLMHEDLLTFEPRRQEIVPALAESWTDVSEGEEPEGTVYRMVLRPDLRFSDGEPFDSEDVVWTVEAILDPAVGSPQRETLTVDGEPIVVTAVDERTVEVRLPSPVAEAGVLFESLYMMPEHRLGRAYAAGELAEAWGVETRPSELAGLGPFRLTQYVPGERITLERNPHYWGRDADGGALPYLDEIVVLSVADQQAGLLRFEAGEIDLFENVTVEAFERLRSSPHRLLRDLGAGTSYEFLFFNLNRIDPETRPDLVRKQGWFREPRFRRALTHAVDRRAIADLVYGGRATPLGVHVSPGNQRWYSAEIGPPERSLEQAEELLAEAGFQKTESGRLVDAEGHAVELTLVTNSSNARRVQTATVVQEDLSRLGMDVRVVPLDFGALLDRVGNTFDYEIGLLGLGWGGVDPSTDLNVWHSSGSNHLWHLGTDCPTTPWEQRIDDLMTRQKSELDADERKRLYHEVQALVAEHVPVVTLVAPNVLVGADDRLGNLAPTIFEPPILWNVERLYWRSDRP